MKISNPPGQMHSANKMTCLSALIGLVFCVSSFAQDLAQYDTLLKRSERDEVVIGSKEVTTRLSGVLHLEVAELRSYRTAGENDFYLNIYRVVGDRSALVCPALDPEMTFSGAVDAYKKVRPEWVLAAPDGTVAVLYVAGFSGDSGSSLGCMIPGESESSFIHLAANSVGFADGGDTKNFERDFRERALRFVKILRSKKEPTKS